MDRNLYGTTTYGGAYTKCAGGNGCGTVFQITPNGKLTVLHSFCPPSSCGDGALPKAALIEGSDGNLYGTTVFGGRRGNGTVFKITPSGTLTALHRFDPADGVRPQAGLVQDTNGKFYGTTPFGGANNYGTVFRLSLGLSPFVETQTASGKVGAAVKILGTNLTGTTSVSFNGTAALFKVVSSSLITTTVPAGATTGFVSVTTPKGTLKSNRKFLVLQ
jgi:uncharacterized repeat protein (TIGR03803 family)